MCIKKGILGALMVMCLTGCAGGGRMVRDGHELYWPHERTPITTQELGQPDDVLEAYRWGMDWVNTAAGCELFAYPVHAFAGFVRAPVTLECRNWIDAPRGLASLWYHTGEIYRAATHIPCATPFPETQRMIAVHELLHVVGLAHDPTPGRVMHSNVQYAALELGEGDIEILRSYCR